MDAGSLCSRVLGAEDRVVEVEDRIHFNSIVASYRARAQATSFHTHSTLASIDRTAPRKMKPTSDTSDFVRQAIRKLNNLEPCNRGSGSDCDSVVEINWI